MKSRLPLIVSSLLLTLITLPAYATPETFTVDPVHSMVFFKVQHAGAGYTYGMFFGPEGTFSADKEHPENSSVQVQIKAEAINTGNTNRDNHLRSPDFLNAKQFRVISFKSTSVKPLMGNTYELKGTLSLHGVDKEISALLTESGRGEMQGKTKVGYEAQFSIKRSDFGMNNMIGPVGDEIHFMVTLEGDLKE